MADDRPEAENGALALFPLDDPALRVIEARWPFARVSPFGTGARIDLSTSPRGSCPGFNDLEGLALLARTGPRRVVIGFFCDGRAQAEGVRVVEGGREVQRGRVDWATAQPRDPIAWPVAGIALSLGVPLEAITRVRRPERPPLAVALEALLNGAPVEDAAMRHQALGILGGMNAPPATAALVRALAHDDWVTRFHAVRAYARVHRQPGQGGNPPLDALLADADEGVREAALRGISELLPSVEFADAPLHRQIDAAIARGLADADDDVRALAEQVRELRRKLLG